MKEEKRKNEINKKITKEISEIEITKEKNKRKIR